MKITMLGSGGGSGIPNAFCECLNCEAARAAGGKSLRNGPSVLINDDLLIDCGPDVRASLRQLGLRLTSLRTLIITHRHSDHFDPWFFWERRGVNDTDLPQLCVYAPQDVLDEVFAFYQRQVGLDRSAVEARMRTVWQPISAGMMKLVGPYRLHFFPATHAISESGRMEVVLGGVSDATGAYLHCYDTGPLSAEAWAMLGDHHFDAVVLDSCFGLQSGLDSREHLTADETIATAARMREEGILKPDGLAVATHFVHQSPGIHEDLVGYYEPQGVDVAYDGMTITLDAAHS